MATYLKNCRFSNLKSFKRVSLLSLRVVNHFKVPFLMHVPSRSSAVLAQEVSALSKVGRVVDIWHAGKMFYTFSTWGLAFGGYDWFFCWCFYDILKHKYYATGLGSTASSYVAFWCLISGYIKLVVRWR